MTTWKVKYAGAWLAITYFGSGLFYRGVPLILGIWLIVLLWAVAVGLVAWSEKS